MGTSKLGFTKMNISEFEIWAAGLKVARTILYIQQHHTWSPSYVSFKGNNHFELQQAMKNYHVSNNGWMDIGQHFTTFPDGSILTGRSLEQNPACILGFNAYAICIENLGNFDKGKDEMTVAHRDAIVRMTAAISKKFSIPVNSDKIVYHHWFNLSTGERNNGAKNNKTCPGTDFFGGNSVVACQQNFLPLVSAVMTNQQNLAVTKVLLYAVVTANSLNVRTSADAKGRLADGSPAILGSVIRVYEIKNGWYKISSTQQRWVKSSFTKVVELFRVNANTLNVRNGPGTSYPKVGILVKDQEVFVLDEKGGWYNIQTDMQWVKKDYLTKI
ncbi:SH3 domain-containing protein [Pedobacter frigiditerrae]|uniref:SH3 domain-containing protein n=1 Tax=Pedobacter frigiditerrae TaxID=2530452 RepID=UPI00292F5928|nr:SH3 domain-containing protein [Pedobacter frigiditerrae]